MATASLTTVDLYRLLPQTNCGRCLLPTCLAFAAAVVSGKKKISECPLLAEAVVSRLAGQLATLPVGPDQAAFIDQLEKKIANMDLARIAVAIGGVWDDGVVRINSLGKDFQVDQQGKMTSRCHIIPWVKAPLLSYITNPNHTGITGTWISFRELEGGIDWQGLFHRHCELVLKDLVDTYPTLLGDIMELFAGRAVEGGGADIAFVLHPLPHFPILISYQAADEDLDSDLTIFFDTCCGVNLHIKSIFTLCSGLVRMFDKIARLHG